LGDRPPASPPTPSSSNAPINVRRSPKRSSSHGVSSIDNVIATMKLADTHCARSCPSTKCRLRSGIATFTIVAEMTDDTAPTISVKRTSHLKRSP